MKTLNLSRILLALTALFLTGCAMTTQGDLRAERGLPRANGLYDNHAFLVDARRTRLEPIFESIVRLHTESLFRAEDGELVKVENMGTGTVLSGGYILTLDHVVSRYSLQFITPFGKVERPAVKLADKTYLVLGKRKVPLQPFYKNRADDIALFRVPEGIPLKTFPYRIGNSDDLRVGNFVYVVGNPMNFGLNVREGIVSAVKAPPVLQKVDAKAENAFMVSNGLNPGDSGSPVIAIRDGKFELVGISQGTFFPSQRMGWVIRINAIRKKLEQAHVRLGTKEELPSQLAEEGESPLNFLARKLLTSF